MNILYIIIVVLTKIDLGYGCPGRCSQNFYKAPERPFYRAHDEINEAVENTNSSDEIFATRITFRISARGLPFKPYGYDDAPDPYPLVWINSNQEHDDICKVENSQNPDWYSKDFSFDYTPGDETFIRVEIWDEEPGATDSIIGHTLFYAKDMVEKDQILQSTLWKKERDNMYTGTVQINVRNVVKYKRGAYEEL